MTSNAENNSDFSHSTLVNFAKLLGGLVVLILAALAVFRITFVDYIPQHELPYMFDRRTGEVSVLPHTGYVINPPYFVEVHGIDLRPHQVLLTVGSGTVGANNRVLNAKLVQFNPDGLKEFIKLHGLQSGDVSAILKIYAYDQQGRSFPFLKVESETL